MMSGRLGQQIKTKSKSNRPKSQTQKNRHQKSKRHKTRTTRAYENNEREVQVLLENTSLSIDASPLSHRTDELARSLDFFCRISEEELRPISTASAATQRHGKREEKQEKESDEENSDLTSTDEADQDAISDNDEAISPSSPTTSMQQREHTASTYIPIEEDVLVRVQAIEKFIPDSNLLYKPTAQLTPDLALAVNSFAGGAKENGKPQKPLSANTCRMLQRHQVEQYARDEPICIEFIKELQLQQANWTKSLQGYEQRKLYRSFCPHKFHPVFCEPTRQPNEIPTRKFVRIYLNELAFTAHPHLLEEHRLSNELEQLYEQHVRRQQQRICEKLRARLHTERHVVNELLQRESLSDNGDEQQQDSARTKERRARKLEEQLRSVRALRSTLYEEEAQSKQLLKNILDTWMRLKALRKTQEFQCTRIKLRIRVEEPTNMAEASHRWTERFETDLNEIYREELELYYRAKRLWKARGRGAKNALDQPIKPSKPDIRRISADLRAKLAACLGAPGEPHIDIQLHRACVEEFYNLPGLRRLKSFYMKIYFDDEFVSATRSYRIEPDLRLAMNEVFGVFLERHIPKEIRVTLYEKLRLQTARKVADIRIPFTKAIQANDTEEQRITFTAQKPIEVSGRLTICLQSEELRNDANAQWYVPTISTSTPSQEATIKREMHVEHLLAISDEMAQSTEDTEKESDQEVTNDETTEATNSHQNSTSRTCTFAEELLQFCATEELTNNRRFKLLRSRYLKNDARTRDLRFIAALDNELEYDWNDKGGAEEEEEEAVIDVGDWMDAIDLHKHEGKKYLKQLYEAIRSQCARLGTAAAERKDLLIGDMPATWSSFFQVLGLIFNPKRSLRLPLQRSDMQSPARALDMNAYQSFKIILNIVRATGIPVRIPHGSDSESKQQRSSDSPNTFLTKLYKYSNVRPFITLTYKDKYCRTLTVEGSNPTWNEQLIMQFSGSLADLRDDIKISLFDEVIENHLNDDLSMRNIDIYQRIQANWLGEYRFPIYALLAQQKLDGVIELNTPKVLFGYKQPTLEQITNTTSQAGVSVSIEQFPEIKETVRLWYYMAIEPHVTLPRVNTTCLECVELKEVRHYLQQWFLQAQELQPQRYIDPLVCTAEGKRVCITRLLEPIPLPETKETRETGDDEPLELACRFVSLLNVLKGFDPCMSFEGIWLNNQNILDTNWATPKDLGVLLCSFLLGIGMTSWLVIGRAAAYGECTFVLYKNADGELILIDPNTGRRYGVRDVFCPLQKICLVVGQANLYLNIQPESRVTMTNLNFNDTSSWLCAFSKHNPAPLGGVQKLNYDYQLSFNTFELKRNIERKIMKKISSWRALRKTIWNRAFQPRLQKIIQDLEQLAIVGNNGSYTDTKYTDQIAAEFPNYKIYGFTLNFPYTNLTSISERIKSTGIHLNTDKRVEFCLATHIHIYPNNVLSVWIFLISLILKRLN